MDDPLWDIVGIAHGAGAENVSGNVDEYLDAAPFPLQEGSGSLIVH